MKYLINGLAVIGALNLATMAAFTAWLLTDLLNGRRTGRQTPRSLYAVDPMGRHPIPIAVDRTPSEHTHDRAWPA